jgi:hypothetical protein
MNHAIRTEKDLESLIGQYETMRLEFKSSRILGPDKSKPQIIEDLAKDVSAFANTEGGVLVIGIETGKEAEKAMAVAISEGVDPNLRQPEWLQRVVASNISPEINGLVVRTIQLAGPKAGRVAYVIEVPKGVTAHQSPADLKYYGRHELEAKPLPDIIIRRLMNRGRNVHAAIELMSLTRLTAEEEFGRRHSQLAKIVANEKPEKEEAEQKREFIFVTRAGRRVLEEGKKRLEEPKRTFDEYAFELGIRNDGPITIQDCCLSLLILAGPEADFAPKPIDERWIFHFLPESILRQTSSQWGTTKEKVPFRERKLFPEQVLPFPDAKLMMRYPAGATPKNCALNWTLYLEDAPSVNGVIDLVQAIAPPETKTQ